MVGCLVVACRSFMPAPSQQPQSFPPGETELRVGVGRADITPPPGVATFGHGPNARVTNGIWTRLYCRAFVFVADGIPLGIVPCDLPAPSTLLQRRVVEELARRNISLPASRLMLSATHTHGGPAHYFNGKGYTSLGSSQLAGYDDQVVSFLSGRIADAISDALDPQNQRPVKLRWSHRRVFGLTRNRDLNAFLRNSNVVWPDDCPSNLAPDACAIDPELSVLEIADASGPGCTLGWLVFFAMHPTVLSNANRLLGADVFGVTSRALEAELRRLNGSSCVADPLAGIVSTNIGDIVPRWTSNSVDEAIRMGLEYAKQAKETVAKAGESEFITRPVIAARYLEVDFRNNPFGLKNGHRTCPEPELGMRAPFGGSDHPTLLDIASEYDHTPDFTRHDCQTPKRAVPWYARAPARGEDTFPSILPMAVVRLADELISFVPAELTFAAGLRVATEVRDQYAHGPGGKELRTVVAGLTNGYIQYIATEEEYFYQGYEGASTLFGSHSAELVASVSGALARSLLDSSTPLPGQPDVARDFEYWIGPKRDRLPRGSRESSLAELAGQRAPHQTCSIPTARPLAVCFVWTDGAPGVVPIDQPPWIGLIAESAPSPRPLLPASQLPTFVASDRGGLLLDDRGIAFRTSIHYAVGAAWLWTTLFQPTARDWDELAPWGPLRIAVDARSAQPITSTAFSRGQLPPACSVQMQQLCGM
jgi:neutral ceramidase